MSIQDPRVSSAGNGKRRLSNHLSLPGGGVPYKQNFTEAFGELAFNGSPFNSVLPPETLLQMEASFENQFLEEQLLEESYGVDFQNLIWNQNAGVVPVTGNEVSTQFDDGRYEQSASTHGGHGSRKRTKFNTRLYKTELCRSWSELGYCPYGDSRCQFAHGKHELRPVIRHKKYKTVKCKNFLAGYCPYGSRCCFIHNEMQYEDGPAYENGFLKLPTTGAASELPEVGDENLLLVQPGTPLATQCAQQYIRMAASLMGDSTGAVDTSLNVNPGVPPVEDAEAAANDLFLEKLSLDGGVPMLKKSLDGGVPSMAPLELPQAAAGGGAPAQE